jgi:hypothetical protein
MSGQRWDDERRSSPSHHDEEQRDSDEKRDARDNDDEKVEKDETDDKRRKYVPSVWRLYAGPAAYGLAVNGVFGAAGGVTLAIHVHPEEARVLLLGLRGVILADQSGVLGQVNADIGARILLHGSRVGIGLVGFITPGALVVSSDVTGAVGAFHFGALLGPYFDFGAFTFEPLLGPAVIAQKGAVGVFESTLDFGVRF